MRAAELGNYAAMTWNPLMIGMAHAVEFF